MPRPSDSDTLKDIIALTKYTMGFVPFTFIDFIDIILVAAIMFWIYRATRGTNAPYIISGIIMIYLMWVVVRTLNMELLSNILGQFVSVGVIALIIVFQPEIRRFLQMIGMRQKRFNFIARIFNRNDNTSVTIIAPIVQACREMSAHKTGALIVIGRQSDLRLITEGGIAIDAKISTPLLENIFFKNAPLHDGAVVIEGDRIVAAKCILPVTQSDVPKSYGTRHRAAIGMSEISDAIILVVSEETGGISIAHGGTIHRDIAPNQLANLLQRHFGANRQKDRHATMGS
jgi:diadenylate cyclase